MSKTSYAAMSLVAAIPALFLCYLMMMAFLSHADQMSGLMPVVAGVTLLLSAAVAITPIGIMLGGGRKTPKAAKAAAAAPAAESVDELEAEDSLDDDSLGSAEEVDSEWGDSDELDASGEDAGDSEFMESADFESVETSEFEHSEDAVVTAEFESDEGVSDEFEFDDNLSDEFDVDFDFDEDDEIK